MVMSKAELIASLQNEVRILLHLADKVDARSIDYRPTPKQRSTIEWLRYLSIMGPALASAAKSGTFDGPAWTAAGAASSTLDLGQVKAAIAAQRDTLATTIEAIPDADFQTPIEMFGRKHTKGTFLVNMVIGGYAAYRTQIFQHLKSCGHEELNTRNLWAGVDGPV
jgi:hypothetical protein